jgi:two-component system chemotaxis response regulator CheY
VAQVTFALSPSVEETLARKILLADDSVTAQNMGRKILADAGYEVITVNNGSAALKKIAEHKPDLIILDVYMPGYSGLEVCQRLKEAQESSRVPVLLTVGKLEPFKPEEAKRVRADGFIVKPFEASELLSALSKLEDKIVPRAEASKPGRFARVTASLDEGRYDKTVAIDEDSGWKNRISFPPRQKAKSAAEEGDGGRTNNSSVVGRKSLEKPRAAYAEEPRIDLAALAPEGLPKDVTPEEIAALAAAAAQVKGSIAEFTEPPPVQVRTTMEEAEQSRSADALPQEEVSAAAPMAPIAEEKSEETFEQKSIEKFEEKSEEKPGEKIDAPVETSSEAVEAASMAAPSPLDVIAAIAGLHADAGFPPATTLGNGLPAPDAVESSASQPTENEPVTLAVTGAASDGDAPQWRAVSVALGPEDSAISLEHEMQKAYAAFAAAENHHAASVTDVPQSVEPAAATSRIDAALLEPLVSIPATPAPEAAQTLSALGNAEAIRAAVQELEMVAESYGEPASAVGLGPVSVAEPEAASQSGSAASQIVEASSEETSTAATGELPPEPSKPDSPKPDETDSRGQEPKNQESNSQNEYLKNDEPFVAPAATTLDEGYGTVAEKHAVTESALVNSVLVNEVTAEQTSASQAFSHPNAQVEAEPAAAGSGKMAKKESEEAESTAAAWASWQQIRESGDSNSGSELSSHQPESSAPQDAAAMAAAAGAEKAPEEASAESESAAIANIVDSVLADLRPKIFEEISRKMGKKK